MAANPCGRFERLPDCCEASRRERRGEQAVRRGLAGLQRLGHRAEHRLQPGGLRPGDPEGVTAIVQRESPIRWEQAAAEPNAPTVPVEWNPSGVMAGHHHRGDPAFHLVPGNQGGQEVLSAGASRISANASSAERIGTVGWPIAMETSS